MSHDATVLNATINFVQTIAIIILFFMVAHKK